MSQEVRNFNLIKADDSYMLLPERQSDGRALCTVACYKPLVVGEAVRIWKVSGVVDEILEERPYKNSDRLTYQKILVK